MLFGVGHLGLRGSHHRRGLGAGLFVSLGIGFAGRGAGRSNLCLGVLAGLVGFCLHPLGIGAGLRNNPVGFFAGLCQQFLGHGLGLFAYLRGLRGGGFTQFLNLCGGFVAQRSSFLFSLDAGLYVVLFGLGALQLGFAIRRGSQVIDLSVDLGTQRSGFALGGGDQLVGAVLGVSQHGLGFGLGLGGALLGFATGLGQHRGGLGFGALRQALGVGTSALQQGLGIGIGLVDNRGGLFLGGTQQLLDPFAQPGIAGAVGFTQTALGLGQITGEGRVASVEGLDLSTCFSQGGHQRRNLQVDLYAVITPHYNRKICLFFGHCKVLL